MPSAALSTTANRLWDVATKLAVLATGALVAVVISHEVRVSVIEGNRFTDHDARALEDNLKMLFPPEWLREDVNELKASMKTVERELTKLQAEVKAVHGK